MDELLIDDKKYLSTKRAAKVTGYAKDYIGQLCREGRVKARQVGRSWYVLETDVRQHRFGSEEAGPPSVSLPKTDDPKKTEEKSALADHLAKKPVDHTWDAPRYSPEYNEPPQINLLKKESAANPQEAQTQPTEGKIDSTEPLDNLNDAWEAWFANQTPPQTPIQDGPAAAEVPPVSPERPLEPEFIPSEPKPAWMEPSEEPEMQQTDAVLEESVPIIRKTAAPAYPPHFEMHEMHEAREMGRLEPKLVEASVPSNPQRSRKRHGIRLVRLVSLTLALGAVGLAYLQTHSSQALLSKLPAGLDRIAGVSVYKK